MNCSNPDSSKFLLSGFSFFLFFFGIDWFFLIFVNQCFVAGGAAGAVDEECFLKAFEDVPKIQIFSAKNVCEHITKIKEILENTSIEWDKRVDAVSSFLCFHLYI